VVEDLALAGLGLGNEALVKDIEDIFADLLELKLDFAAVIADDGDMLVRTLGFLLLLDAGNDAPGGTAGTDNVLVGDRQQITLVDSELAANLIVSSVVSQRQEWLSRTTA
jgi:hypothetical protein